MSDDKPSWQPLWLACKACKHEWDDWQPSHVRVRIWTTTISLLRCPKCGAGPKRLVMRTKPLAEGFTD